MCKQAFLAELEARLSGLPQDDIAERLTFYSEMIDDRMEEGLSEEEAVAGIGAVDDIVSQIVAETPFTRIVKEKVTPKRALQTWEITLLALGSPLWIVIAATALVGIWCRVGVHCLLVGDRGFLGGMFACGHCFRNCRRQYHRSHCHAWRRGLLCGADHPVVFCM